MLRGRPRSAFRKALEASFAKHGERALAVCWIEHPLEMLRLCGSLEPKTMKYEGAERGMTLEQLDAADAVLVEAQKQIAPPKENPARIRVIGVSRDEIQEARAS